METDLRNHICRFPEIGTPIHGIRFREVVLDQSQPNVVTHLVELFVDLDVIALVIFAQLRNDRAVGEGDQLGVNFIYSTPKPIVSSRVLCSFPSSS